MDVEAALLENSPTLSTISSDCTDTTYSGPGSPYSPESPIIVTSSYKKTKDDEITPRPTPRHPLPPRKPNFRIRPPYLMICISIIEVTLINPRLFIFQKLYLSIDNFILNRLCRIFMRIHIFEGTDKELKLPKKKKKNVFYSKRSKVK